MSDENRQSVKQTSKPKNTIIQRGKLKMLSAQFNIYLAVW